MPPVVQPQGTLAPPAYQYGMPQVAALPNNAPAPGWDGAFPSAAPAPSPSGPEVIGMPTFGSQAGLTAPPAWTPPPQGAAAPTQAELFEQAKVVAVIGDERILLGDIVGLVNQFLEANKSKIPPGREEYYRERITQQVLESEVQSKLVYLDFLRKIRSKGAGEDKITEIHNRVYTQFDEKRLLDMMQKANVSSPVELDAKLREQGSSLMKHKRQFAQKVMSQQWLRENEQVNFEPIITHAQMLDYYYAHEEDYAIQATAKWEHLMARFDKFPDKATAYEAIRAMGNEVYLGGAPLWAVAKRASHGVTASDGGQYESTTKGSLKSKVLDQAIFELPLKQLSPILEDEEGFHIVRVLERQDASRKSFESTQSEIKEAIRKEMVQKQIDAYMDELKKKTPVWTIFDEKNKQAAEEQARRNSEFGQ
jgi:parvulin-like peptidyl-prolyl isomerase